MSSISVSTLQTGQCPADRESHLDLDSHADICVLGNNVSPVEKPHRARTANASFADPALGSATKPTLSGAFKCTLPATSL